MSELDNTKHFSSQIDEVAQDNYYSNNNNNHNSNNNEEDITRKFFVG
jgi:hypothetical protein